eukprot:973469-Amphidinium_carterae.2
MSLSVLDLSSPWNIVPPALGNALDLVLRIGWGFTASGLKHVFFKGVQAELWLGVLGLKA